MSLSRQQLARYAHFALLGMIVVIGAWLRLTALNRQSLWFDEIDIVIRAQQPFSDVLRTFIAQGENGPLYNLLLAIWVRIAGISEIAVRFPSAIAGTVTIPLLYVVARRMTTPLTGLLAAGLLAISPYHVWYSQEAKMYALVVLLALASTGALAEALRSNRRWWWVAYVVATTAMFYMHVATVLVFVAQSLFVLLTRTHWRGRERSWLASAALLTLPYVPIAIWALRVISGGAPTWHARVGIVEAFRIFGIRFAVNRSTTFIQDWGALLYLALALTGAYLLWRLRKPEHWWLLLVSLSIVPVVGLYLVSLRQSVFADRYAIVALPTYLILVAAAVGWLLVSRKAWPVGAAALALLLVLAWVPLRDVNRTSQAEKEDWRSAYSWIAERAEPADVLIISPGFLTVTYDYAGQRDPRVGGRLVATVPDFAVGWLDDRLMVQMIREQVGDARRLWLVQSEDRAAMTDPDGRLLSWLQRRATLLDEHYVTGVRVRLFEMAQPISPERP